MKLGGLRPPARHTFDRSAAAVVLVTSAMLSALKETFA